MRHQHSLCIGTLPMFTLLVILIASCVGPTVSDPNQAKSAATSLTAEQRAVFDKEFSRVSGEIEAHSKFTEDAMRFALYYTSSRDIDVANEAGLILVQGCKVDASFRPLLICVIESKCISASTEDKGLWTLHLSEALGLRRDLDKLYAAHDHAERVEHRNALDDEAKAFVTTQIHSDDFSLQYAAIPVLIETTRLDHSDKTWATEVVEQGLRSSSDSKEEHRFWLAIKSVLKNNVLFSTTSRGG